MRGPSLFAKIITLVCFVSLLGGFVAYRSGVFADLLTGGHQVLSEHDSTKFTRAKYDSLLKLQPDSLKGQGLIDASGRRIFYYEDSFAYTILPGSKSITPIFDLEEVLDSPRSIKEVDSRTYMPPSKSFGGAPPIKLRRDTSK